MVPNGFLGARTAIRCGSVPALLEFHGLEIHDDLRHRDRLVRQVDDLAARHVMLVVYVARVPPVQVRNQAVVRAVILQHLRGVVALLVATLPFTVEVGESRLDLLEPRAACQALGLSLGEFVARLEEQLGSAS